MVTFTEKSYIIEIPSCAPLEEWGSLHQDLCDMLGSIDREVQSNNNFPWAVDLLKNLMPEGIHVEKMVK